MPYPVSSTNRPRLRVPQIQTGVPPDPATVTEKTGGACNSSAIRSKRRLASPNRVRLENSRSWEMRYVKGVYSPSLCGPQPALTSRAGSTPTWSCVSLEAALWSRPVCRSAVRASPWTFSIKASIFRPAEEYALGRSRWVPLRDHASPVLASKAIEVSGPLTCQNWWGQVVCPMRRSIAGKPLSHSAGASSHLLSQ